MKNSWLIRLLESKSNKNKWNKHFLIKYLVLIISFAVSAPFILNGDLICSVIAMWCICAVAIILCGFDFLHPYFWYSVIFCLYSTAHPILRIMEGAASVIQPMLIPLEWLAFCVVLLVISPKKVIHKKLFTLSYGSISRVMLILLGCFVYLFLCFVAMNFLGFSGKNEIYSSNNTLFRVFYSVGVLAIVCYAYGLTSVMFGSYLSKRRAIGVTLLSFACIFFVFATGERDYLFRFIIVLIFVLWAAEKIRFKHLFIFAPIMLVILASSVVLKYFFMSGNIVSSDSNLIETFLYSDFHSASKNLNLIIEYGFKDSFSYTDLIKDFFMFPSDIKRSWLKEFLNQNGSNINYGLGFTIVGEGYVAGGIAGIVVTMVVVGVELGFIYRLSSKNLYYFIFYLVMIYTFMFSMRAYLSTINLGIIKYGLLVLVLFYLLPQKKAELKVTYPAATIS